MPSQAMRGATRDPRRGAIPVVPISYRPFDELESTIIKTSHCSNPSVLVLFITDDLIIKPFTGLPAAIL